MKHKVNNNRPWLDKEESLVIEADCTQYCREVVERVRREQTVKEIQREHICNLMNGYRQILGMLPFGPFI